VTTATFPSRRPTRSPYPRHFEYGNIIGFREISLLAAYDGVSHAR
jgi:hypothetical protein